MQKLPRALQTVVDRLARLPGVGPKSALRMGLTLLNWPEEQVRNLGHSIHTLRDSVCLCSQCGCPSDEEPCSICSDPSRREDLLCLVSDWDALLTIDEAGFYKGKYLVLGGLLSPLDGNQGNELNLERLKKRLDSGQVKELILALGTTREGEATESYIVNLVENNFPDIHISRLAQGIPIGSELKYMDKETLKQSVNYRQSLSGK
ncbi:MAG: recombination mediator RecR [Thermodesulfobacteriota bacterium]